LAHQDSKALHEASDSGGTVTPKTRTITAWAVVNEMGEVLHLSPSLPGARSLKAIAQVSSGPHKVIRLTGKLEARAKGQKGRK
jgi:hypothetical protein